MTDDSPNAAARPAVAMMATVIILGMLIVSASLTLIASQRVQRRVNDTILLEDRLPAAAQSGLEWLYMKVDQTPAWRSQTPSWLDTSLDLFGGDTIEITVSDPEGDALDDDDRASVSIALAAEIKGQRREYSLTAQPHPHEALDYALWSSGTISFGSSNVVIAGWLYAADAMTAYALPTVAPGGSYHVPDGATISAGLEPSNTDAPVIDKPPNAFSSLATKGTTIFLGGAGPYELIDVNLTPTSNPFGTPNPYGIYKINIGSYDIDFRQFHLKGTLFIRGTGSAIIEFDESCWIEPASGDQPVLILDNASGQVHVTMDSTPLAESDIGADLNGDSDTDDSFAPRIEGVVWSNASLVRLANGPWTFRGVWIGDDFEVRNFTRIERDTSYVDLLISGLTDNQLHPVSGTFVETGGSSP